MSFADKFKANLAYAGHFATTWVATAATGAVGYWLQLPPEAQAATLASVPALKYLAPVAGLVAFIVAKGFPQPKLEAKLGTHRAATEVDRPA